MFPRIATTLFTLGGLLTGCADRVSAPPGPLADGPSLDFMNNPDNGNIRITRYGTHYAISWTDPETGLRATHTTYPLGSEPDCGPQELLDPIADQDVGLLEDPWFVSQIRANVMGDLWIIVRDTRQAGACYGQALVAEGMGRLHYVDNDIFGAGPEAANANTWGFTGAGLLTATDGSQVRYSGHSRFTVTAAGDFIAVSPMVNLR